MSNAGGEARKGCLLPVELERPLLSLSDEDMQSLASLMSFKPTDIGNLDDFNESDEDEEKKPAAAAGRQQRRLLWSPRWTPPPPEPP